MARIKSLKKDQREVRGFIRRFNKSLKEDCFAGRFEVRQIGRLSKGLYNGWSDKTFICKEDPTFYGVAGKGFHLWYNAVYELEFIDHEQPERNFKVWLEKHDIVTGFLGNRSMYGLMNNFIIESDFWEKWEDADYARDHWFSGEELKRRVADNKNWSSVDKMIESGEGKRWS